MGFILQSKVVKNFSARIDILRFTIYSGHKIKKFRIPELYQVWGTQFDEAGMVLDSQEPQEKYYHKDLVPADNYSLLARQILFSAACAWVFGGMMSWNDQGFEAKDNKLLYEQLSEELYENIIEAVTSSINSF
jgi:hypothetical protein